MLSVLSVLGLTLPLLTATPQEAQAVIAANNQFALDLYGRLSGRDGNLFFSPYSIYKTLAMTSAGARGDTARELAAVLHGTLGPDRQHLAFLEARNLINRKQGGLSSPGPSSAGGRGVRLSLSANLWGQRGSGFRKNYLN